ncbi:unnamed protein product [Orchesella dallaii]|uniref:Uncharacterized protein n=1 Tax=Orchesella dallaii TaxID=48710 RepID=A0ABP1Q273_9HEXA
MPTPRKGVSVRRSYFSIAAAKRSILVQKINRELGFRICSSGGESNNSVKILVSIISSLTKVVPWKRGDRSKPALTESPSSNTTGASNTAADYTVGPSKSHPGQWCVTVKETRALRSNLRLNQRVSTYENFC